MEKPSKLTNSDLWQLTLTGFMTPQLHIWSVYVEIIVVVP